MKNHYLDLAEDLGVSPAQLLEQLNGKEPEQEEEEEVVVTEDDKEHVRRHDTEAYV